MRVLDLFCGAGGAGIGYRRAGATIIGVDIDPQPDYPGTFWHADALTILDKLLDGKKLTARGEQPLGLDDFDFIHASPPCQGYTALSAVHGNTHPLLIPEVRERLTTTGKPSTIENVQGAPLRRDMTLCGEMFGLDVIRHRYFELIHWKGEAPAHIPHRGRVSGWRHGEFYEGPYVAVYGNGGGKANVAQARAAMGIEHMDELHDLVEAIPPAYTEWVLGEFQRKK